MEEVKWVTCVYSRVLHPSTFFFHISQHRFLSTDSNPSFLFSLLSIYPTTPPQQANRQMMPSLQHLVYLMVTDHHAGCRPPQGTKLEGRKLGKSWGDSGLCVGGGVC